MVRKDTDNLVRLHHDDSQIINSSAIVSVEQDFELPRGYVAKIRKVIFRAWHNAARSQVGSAGLLWCLLRDPDDSTTIRAPENEVGHDVIAQHQGSYFYATNNLMFNNAYAEYTFDELEDIITARNLRLNVQMTVAIATDDVRLSTDIYYTLEKVTDSELLDLLDIL